MSGNDNETVCRKLITAGVSRLILASGCDMVHKDVLGILTEMLQALLLEMGYATKNFCEIAGRSEPAVSDIILASVRLGLDIESLQQFLDDLDDDIISDIQYQAPPKPLNMLPAGVKAQQPTYIPAYLPEFPDPHAYIRTPTHKQPIIDYEAIREKAAVQKRDMEKALTRYMSKTNPVNNLFDDDDNNIFQLVACKVSHPPYMQALSPQDQVFDPEDLEYDLKAHVQGVPLKKRFKSESQQEIKVESGESSDRSDSASLRSDKEVCNWDIDNPYLAATKLPARVSPDS